MLVITVFLMMVLGSAVQLRALTPHRFLQVPTISSTTLKVLSKPGEIYREANSALKLLRANHSASSSPAAKVAATEVRAGLIDGIGATITVLGLWVVSSNGNTVGEYLPQIQIQLRSKGAMGYEEIGYGRDII